MSKITSDDSSEEKNIDDRADFFLNYAKELHKDKLERFRRLEDKSIKFVSIVGVLITILLLLLRSFHKYVFVREPTFYFVIVLTEVGVLFFFLCYSWYLILKSLSMGDTLTLSHDAKAVENFIMDEKISFNTVQGAIAKGVMHNAAKLHVKHEAKAKVVGLAYTAIMRSGLAFLVLIFTILLFHLTN